MKDFFEFLGMIGGVFFLVFCFYVLVVMSVIPNYEINEHIKTHQKIEQLHKKDCKH